MTEKLQNACIRYLVAEGKSSAGCSFDFSPARQFDDGQYCFLPGFCDVHVHFREPGFSYKETIKSGSASASRGGYTTVFTMPNLSPVPDSVENISEQTSIISRDTSIAVYPYGSITVGQKGEQLADLQGIAPYAIAFSDDGRGVQDSEMMARAMEIAKSLDKAIVAHCEVNDLLFGGYIHDGAYAKAHGHRGICSQSEWKMIERDIELAKKTGVKYHVCHISTKESVDLIRKAKADGVDITCETAPHYLILDDSNLIEDGRMKMNPPLRDKSDKEALIQGVIDGTIDMIATDHAPHSAEEKSRGLEKSAFGVVGLETAFPAMYTHFVKTGIITMDKLVKLLSTNAKERFNLPASADYSVWKLDEKFTVNPAEFLSKGKATPFENMQMYGVNYLTVRNGKVVYEKK